MILSAENLGHSYGVRTLFKNISFNIEEGDKIGVIGVNGTGKSTLLRDIATGEPSEGKITKNGTCVIEYLPQDPAFDPDATVLEQVFRGESPQLDVVRRYEEAVQQAAAEPENKAARQKLLALQQEMDSKFAWQMESEAKAVLDKLGITDLQQPMKELSGGQRKRVALAGVLVRPSDLLILDEPTNHMDNETVAWLEEVLQKRKGALLMVTHDRYFFDRVVNRTLEIDGGEGYLYTGNYSLFLQKREERRIAAAGAAQRLRNVYRRELAWISRGAEARRTKSKERIERFNELKKEVNNIKTEQQLEISSVGSRLGKTIIECEHIGLDYGGKTYIDDFNYVLLRNDRIGIVGPNGSGKSSLMDIIAGRLAPTRGTVKVGQTVKIGYFAQHSEFKDADCRVLEYIKNVSDYIETADGTRITAAQMLERFLFPPELQWVPVSKLSGGEKRRLYLLSVLMSAPNVLILDEPTNDLDIVTLNVLEEYLRSFKGCVIVVSHDRYFMDKVVDHLLVFKGQGDIRDFPGNYSDYRDWKLAKAEHEKEAVKPKEEKTQRVRLNDKRRMTFKERKEFEQLEKEIADLEAEKKQLEEALCSGSLSVEELTEKSKRLPMLNDELDEKTMRWLELSEIEA